METNEKKMKRYMNNTPIGRGYLLVGDQDIMFSTAGENQRENDAYISLMNGCCRLASKAMKARLDMKDIADVFVKADEQRGAILNDIAGKIEEYLKSGR